MAPQEAINRLKNICFTIKNEPEEIEAAQYIGALKLAISALEKQVPEKPMNKYYCPSCEEQLMGKVNYCEECGQAIDWSEGA
nr:MAG TPA: Trm112p-like protein [Caudoviricetes sp.]